MKKAAASLFYLCIIFLLILSACGPDLTIELPPEDTAVPEAAAPEEPTAEPTEEPAPESVETVVADLLGVGTAMKWFDDGYLVFVPAGEVTLGDNEYENNPVHTVVLEDYWIYMFKVTNGQYSQCVAAGACLPPADEEPYPDIYDPEIKDEPVVGVDWEQAGVYCEWMNGRLPTEAEWEKAARGPEAYTYPWGEEDPDCDLLNYAECEDPATSLVYEYPEGRSFYQAFDMAGNAYEWVSDLYEDDFVSQLPGEEPYDPPLGTERSVRGSSYLSEEEWIPSAQLFYLEPDKYRTDLGFRCVIGEAEPASFAYTCKKTAYVPGLPAPFIPGPTPDENEPPDYDFPPCKLDLSATHYEYCPNPGLQQGGLDLLISAPDAYEVYVDSWSSDYGAVCIDGTDPLGCFGPENTPVDFVICATCRPQLALDNLHFYCDAGYILTDTVPPSCEYVACPPQPGPPCPAGFIYDQPNDICIKVGTQSDDCPEGYSYNKDTDCCEAVFAPPAEDPTAPSDNYLVCPPGTGNVMLIGASIPQGEYYAVCTYLALGSQDPICITPTFNLGDCREIPKECKNPSQYTAQGPCEAAACKWEQQANIAGAVVYKCVLP